jgi:RNA polymerase sigma-70 factor (ECF subfamily)
MAREELELRLSQITTLWSMVFEAGAGAREAQERLLERYGGAVHRYLLGVVRDPDLADDLAQEFAVRFLRGDFRRADPQRGRFRNLLKTALRNLVTDHYRRQKVRPQPLPPDNLEPAAAPEAAPDLDQQFLDSWRQELLTRAWEALARHQEQSAQPFYAVLRFRADHPDLHAAQLAEQLGPRLGKTVTDNWVRQVLFRARKLFADFLLEDVLHSLQNPSLAQLEEELLDLGLLEYCQSALAKRGRCNDQ